MKLRIGKHFWEGQVQGTDNFHSLFLEQISSYF